MSKIIATFGADAGPARYRVEWQVCLSGNWWPERHFSDRRAAIRFAQRKRIGSLWSTAYRVVDTEAAA